MTPNLCIAISPATMRALLDYQLEQANESDPAALADQAIRDWIKRQFEQARPAGQREWQQAAKLRNGQRAQSLRGYSAAPSPEPPAAAYAAPPEAPPAAPRTCCSTKGAATIGADTTWESA